MYIIIEWVTIVDVFTIHFEYYIIYKHYYLLKHFVKIRKKVIAFINDNKNISHFVKSWCLLHTSIFTLLTQKQDDWYMRRKISHKPL